MQFRNTRLFSPPLLLGKHINYRSPQPLAASSWPADQVFPWNERFKGAAVAVWWAAIGSSANTASSADSLRDHPASFIIYFPDEIKR